MSVQQLKELSIRNSSLNLRCESLICNNVITPSTPQAVQTVNQATSFTTPVDCGTNPSRYVIINTQNTTIASGSASTFTLENTNITPSSVVLASIINMSSAVAINGMPVLLVKNITTGSCTISNMNTSPSSANFTGNLKIYVEIIETTTY
jgi:hypothetical protein